MHKKYGQQFKSQQCTSEAWIKCDFFFNSLSINLKKTRESQQDNNKPLLCKQKFFKSKVYYHSFLSAFEIILNEIQATV